MTFQTFDALIYLLAGIAIIYFFQVRRKRLNEFTREEFPGLDQKSFKKLKTLLKTAYERMLYMGVLFFPLAYVSYSGDSMQSKLFFLVLIVLLFIANIPPRHNIMRLLEQHGLSIKALKEQGINL